MVNAITVRTRDRQRQLWQRVVDRQQLGDLILALSIYIPKVHTLIGTAEGRKQAAVGLLKLVQAGIAGVDEAKRGMIATASKQLIHVWFSLVTLYSIDIEGFRSPEPGRTRQQRGGDGDRLDQIKSLLQPLPSSNLGSSRFCLIHHCLNPL